jgi:hypothetical protein
MIATAIAYPMSAFLPVMTAEQTKASLTLTAVVKPRAADVPPTAIARRTVIARVMSA